MKKLKVIKPALISNSLLEGQKKSKKQKKNTLPPDTYKDVIEPLEFRVDGTRKIVFSVKRAGEYGEQFNIDMRYHVETEEYIGFTKKGITFSSEYLDTLIGYLCKIERELEGKE